MLRVQPVCVKDVKNVLGRCRSSSCRSPPRPVATATRICVTQSGCAGQPGILMTGRPAFDLNPAPSEPPCLRLRNCRPSLSEGLGAVAGTPPQVAQSPMATTNCATPDSSLTQSFIGRPQKRFHSPVPFGALTTVPSNTKISSGISPETHFCRMRVTLSPSSRPSEGCQSTLMPKSVTRSQALGSSAFRNDIVFPEQAPPCSQSKFAMLSSPMMPTSVTAADSHGQVVLGTSEQARRQFGRQRNNYLKTIHYKLSAEFLVKISTPVQRK